MSILKKQFFGRSTLKVARELLGKFLVVQHVQHPMSDKKTYMITEVEAYDGPHDKASHAHRGKTLRNEPMFGPAGVWYVYFVYGMYNMLNIVTGPKDYPAAVLIRGIDAAPSKRGEPRPNLKFGRGPARLTKFLKIDKKFNNKPATKKTGLWIEDRGVKIKKSQIKTSPRIGVDYAGEWKDKHYRFYL